MLFESNTLIIFSQFCDQPQKNWHLRELARTTTLSTTATKHAVETLLEQKLIKENQETLYKTYQANWGEETYHFSKKIHNFLALKASGLLEHLEKLSPDCIILFGSYEKGEDLAGSDIDLYLQASEETVNLSRFETKLKRTIQLIFAPTLEQLPEELASNIDNGTLLSGFKRWQRSRPRQTKNKRKISTN